MLVNTMKRYYLYYLTLTSTYVGTTTTPRG